MWGSQAASNARIEGMSTALESQAEMIAEQGRRIESAMKHTAAIGREVVAQGDQMVGRLRQFDHKFGQLLGALERDSDRRLRALEKRVSRLEDKGDPAA